MDGSNSQKNRSDCPINFSLEAVGDSWSLLIVRDIAFWGKRTFGEFLRSNERIATNILSKRLRKLESEGILTKTVDPDDKRRDIYSLTEKGLDLIPIVMELGAWAAKYDPRQPEEFRQFVAMVRTDQVNFTKKFIDLVRSGGAIFHDAVGRH
jgi:DNA-binding HxlR family transcriptional regulator